MNLTDRINIQNIYITPLDVETLHAYIQNKISSNCKSLILNVNVQAINLSNELPWLKKIFNQASLVFSDGAGIILAAKILGYSIPQRITYADWMWQLAAFGQEMGFSFFFLGGKPGIAYAASKCILARFPKLRILGTHHGYFNKTKNSTENIDVINQLNEFKPDILIVGFGMPLQEKWLLENWEDIDATIGLTGGAVFDYISGNLKRAPKWMTDHGFEWLGRLIIEPKRLWKRYIIGLPLFFFHVFIQKLSLSKIGKKDLG